MAQRGTFQSPEAAIAELHRLPDPRTAAEVRDRLNIIERALALIDPSTDYEAEILDALHALIRTLDTGGAGPGLDAGTIEALLRRQLLGDMDTTNLPIGQTGTAVEPIENQQQGTGFFETWAGEFAVEVKAGENVDQGDPITVIRQPGNVVRVDDQVASIARADDGPIPRAGPKATINVANQAWVNGDPGLEPTVTPVSFDGDLAAGDEEVVCRVESTIEGIPIDGARVGVTSHKADIDNDATTADESVVRYHFEYKSLDDVDDLDDAEWTEFPWSPTVLPRGDLASPVPLLEDHVVGPLYGLRIRFENRTDEGSLVSTTVNEEDMGGLIEARAVV